MRKFNQQFVVDELGRIYHEDFPSKKVKATLLSYGLKDNNTGKIDNVFFCLDVSHGMIGFAVHYSSKKILRLYNHEGSDVGLVTNMTFVTDNSRKQIIKDFKF